MLELNGFYNMDCMEGMKQFPDKYFELAMADFHFKHSNTEYTYSEDGKRRTYKVCDICGAEQQNNYGLEVSHARRGAEGSYRLSLCGKCANKILPILEGALDEIHATVNELRND